MIFSRCQLYKGKAGIIRKNRTPTQKSIKSWKKPLNMTLLDMHIGIFMRGIEWRCYFCKILNSKGRKIDFLLSKPKNPCSKIFSKFKKVLQISWFLYSEVFRHGELESEEIFWFWTLDFTPTVVAIFGGLRGVPREKIALSPAD
jgi:hypothetical protein